jgi:6-phosphogluconate dehydrogenase
MKADIGLIGLAVMGQNLVLNMNDHGYKVASITEPAQQPKNSWQALPTAPKSSGLIHCKNWSIA